MGQPSIQQLQAECFQAMEQIAAHREAINSLGQEIEHKMSLIAQLNTNETSKGKPTEGTQNQSIPA